MPDGAEPRGACEATSPQVYPASCASRFLLEQVADKWSVLVVSALWEGPLRFNALRRRIEGITQKALTDTLRRLERNGMVARRVIPASPVAVGSMVIGSAAVGGTMWYCAEE